MQDFYVLWLFYELFSSQYTLSVLLFIGVLHPIYLRFLCNEIENLEV